MDIYTISRIFKVFKRKTDNNRPLEINNIIIYSGYSHSLIYKEFLESLSFQKIQEIGYTGSDDNEYESRCLDMSSFTQPFFG